MPRSSVVAATDVGEHLAAQGIDLAPGDGEGTMTVPPDQNHDLLFEFTE